MLKFKDNFIESRVDFVHSIEELVLFSATVFAQMQR